VECYSWVVTGSRHDARQAREYSARKLLVNGLHPCDALLSLRPVFQLKETHVQSRQYSPTV
jgi:hypothetical protein